MAERSQEKERFCDFVCKCLKTDQGVPPDLLQRPGRGAARRARGEFGECVAQGRQRAREATQAPGTRRLDGCLERAHLLAAPAHSAYEAVDAREQDIGIVHQAQAALK